MRQNRLTAKQERFAQYVADGMSQSDAYRKAFDVDAKTKSGTVRKRASELMAKGNISGMVDSLREQLSEKALWTREMSVQALMRAYAEGNGAVKVAAVKELNQMHGFNEATKYQLSGADGLPLTIQVEFVKP